MAARGQSWIDRVWYGNSPAGLLLLPYLAWVTFATFLNRAIWKLNS